MNKIFKLLFILLFFYFFICNIEAKTLKQLKDELARDEANKTELIKKSKEVQNKINQMNSKMKKLENEINNNEKKIKITKKEIENLNEDIKNKQKEIDNLVSFFQINESENIYMEYVFKAK